jgi:hypothetical protein
VILTTFVSPEPRRNGVVQLHHHNQGDADISVDKAEGCAPGIERLGDENTTANAVADLGRGVGLDEIGVGGVRPAPLQHGAGNEDV